MTNTWPFDGGTWPFDRVPSEYALLLDPAPRAQPPQSTLDLPEGMTLAQAALAIEELLRRETKINGFVVEVAGQRVGVTSRDFLETTLTSAGQRSTDADRATQPGESTWYKLIRFECTQCEHRVFRVFHDARDTPECNEPVHGAMVLRT